MHGSTLEDDMRDIKTNVKRERYERKFVSYDLTLADMLSLIKTNPLLFREVFPLRQVNSLYLDTIDRSDYSDNRDGNPYRSKTRIRWYGSLLGKITPRLEIKTKGNQISKKFSFSLAPFMFDRAFTLKKLKQCFATSPLPREILARIHTLEPVLITSYKRRYFLSADGLCRLTLDSDLVFYEIKNHDNLFQRKMEDKELFILELKYYGDYEDSVQRITQHFPFRLARSSKYIAGVNAQEP